VYQKSRPKEGQKLNKRGQTKNDLTPPLHIEEASHSAEATQIENAIGMEREELRVLSVASLPLGRPQKTDKIEDD
jgi:peptidoglycan hydrolase CwlO-like protein